jgi:hypothetical protein
MIIAAGDLEGSSVDGADIGVLGRGILGGGVGSVNYGSEVSGGEAYLFGEETRVDVSYADEEVIWHDLDQVRLPAPYISSVIYHRHH